MRKRNWKVGDTYIEKAKEFLSMDPEWNRFLTKDIERAWTVFQVHETYILCESDLGYKAFPI